MTNIPAKDSALAEQAPEAADITFWVARLDLTRPLYRPWVMNVLGVLFVGVFGALVWLEEDDGRWPFWLVFGFLWFGFLAFLYRTVLRPVPSLLSGFVLEDSTVVLDGREEYRDLTATVVGSGSATSERGLCVTQALLIRLPSGNADEEPQMRLAWLEFRAPHDRANPFLRRFWGIAPSSAVSGNRAPVPFYLGTGISAKAWSRASETAWPVAVERVRYSSNAVVAAILVWFVALLVLTCVECSREMNPSTLLFAGISFVIPSGLLLASRLAYWADVPLRVVYGPLNLVASQTSTRVDASLYVDPKQKLAVADLKAGVFNRVQRNSHIWRVVETLYDSTTKSEEKPQ